MNDLVRVLRGQRIDGRGTDEIMRLAADEIESLQSQLSYRIEERDDSNRNLTSALRREVASKDRLAEAEALLTEARQCFFLWCNGFMPILKTGRCINDIDTVLHANNANVSVRCPDCVDGAYAGTDRICLTCSGLGALKRAADIDAHLAREQKP